ncbi:MAG: hypothetical protein IJG00_00750 [Clostridia bacterium]|nr:hypothetical protein [Clostridia bacterium]
MKKRKVLFSLLLILSIFVGFGSKAGNVCATKSINSNGIKEKIKSKIEINQKLLKTLYDKNVELKKWKRLILNPQKVTRRFFFVREKSLVSFQNEAVNRLAADLNKNSSYAKYILKCFGFKKDIINFIFGDGKSRHVNVKFEKMGCCPELIIKISRKFNSKKEKYKFIDDLKEEISNENLKIFFSPYGEDDVCNMCIVLM